MATATTSTPGLSNDQLIEVLGLIKSAASVERKLTVPDHGAPGRLSAKRRPIPNIKPGQEFTGY